MTLQVPGVILQVLGVGPFMSNCYIVGSEATKEALVIDPGADAEAILEAVKELGLAVKAIVLTHGHVDHLSALAQVKEAIGAPFLIHADEVETALSRMSQGFAAMSGGSRQPLPQPDRLLRGGDTVEVGDLKFTVLHTPGHSPGGICLLGHGLVFTGDTLFNFGIGRTDFPGCSLARLMDSIYTKLMVLPDQTVALPGHGPGTTIGTERRWNPFLRR